MGCILNTYFVVKIFIIVNPKEKVISTGNVLYTLIYDRLSPARNSISFTVTEKYIHIQIINADLRENVLQKLLTFIVI